MEGSDKYMAGKYDYTIKIGIDQTELANIGSSIDTVFNKKRTLNIDVNAMVNQIQSALSNIKVNTSNWFGSGGSGTSNQVKDKIQSMLNSLYSSSSRRSNDAYSLLFGNTSASGTKTNAYIDKLKEYNDLLVQAKKNVSDFEKIARANPSIDKDSNEYTKALAKSLELYEKINKAKKDLSSDKYDSRNKSGSLIGEGTLNNINKVQDALDKIKSTISSNHNGENVVFGKISNDGKSIAYQIEDASGAMTKYKASLDLANGGLRELQVSSEMASSGTNNLKNSVAGYVAGLFTLRTAINAIKDGIKTVTEFDSGLTQISMTMDTSASQITNLGDKIVKSAKDMGTTIAQSLDVSKIYANMKSTPNEIIELTTPTVELANAAQIDTSTVSNYIQSVMKQFDMMPDQAEHIADVYESISSNIQLDFAQGVKDIAEGVEAAGSLVNESGMSFEKFAAIVGKTAETTRQSGSQIGNSWKTILTRISKASKVSDDIDPESLSKASESLHKIGIEVYNSSGEFNNIDDILTQLAGKWNGLSDAMQSEISFNIAATRNRNILSAALKNYTEITNLATEAEQANGLAAKNQEKHMASYAAKLNVAKDEIDQVALQLLNNNLTKGAIDAFNSVLEVYNQFLSKTKSVGTALTGIFGLIGINRLSSALGLTHITSLFQSLGKIGNIAPALSSAASAFTAFGGGLSGASAGLSAFVANINPVVLAITGIAAAVGIAIGAIDLFTESFAEVKQKADAARDTYNGTKTELQNVNTELETTQSRIAELEGKKGSLSFVEATELEKLKQVNEELSLQKTILEKMAGVQQEEAAKAANDVLTKPQRAWTTGEKETPQYEWDDPTYKQFQGDIIDKAQSQVDRLADLESQRSDLLIKLSNYNQEDMVESTGWQKFIGNLTPWDADNKALKDLDQEISKIKAGLLDSESVIRLNFQSLFDENGGIIPGYEGTVQRINNLFNGLSDSVDEATQKQEVFDNIFKNNDSFKAAKEGLIELAKANGEAGITAEDVKNNYKELYDYIENSPAISMSDLVSGINAEAFAGDFKTEIDSATVSLEEFSTSVENAINKQSLAVSALNSSASATGLSTDEIDKLTIAYKDLDSFDAQSLFENTAHGVIVNRDALKALQDEANANTLTDIYQRIADKQKELSDAKLKGFDTSDIESEIQSLYRLEAQVNAATSAFNQFVLAQSTSNQRDNFEGVAKSYSSIGELIKQGWVTDDSVTSYLDLLLGTDRIQNAKEAYDSLSQTIDGTSNSLKDYFTFDDSGNFTSQGAWMFVDDIASKLGEDFVTVGENGKYALDLTGDKLQTVADEFGTTTEFVELLGRSLADAGMNVTFDPDPVRNYNEQMKELDSASKNAQDALKELQSTSDSGILGDIDFNYDKAAMSIDEIDAKISELTSKQNEIDISTEEGQTAVSALESEIDALNTKKIMLQIGTQIKNGASIDELLNMSDADLQKTLNIDASQIDEARSRIEALQMENVDVPLEFKLDQSQFEQLTGTSNMQVDVTPVVSEPPEIPDAEANVNYTPVWDYELLAPTAEGEATYNPNWNYDLLAPDVSGNAVYTPSWNFELTAPTIHGQVVYEKVGLSSGTMTSVATAHADGTAYNVLNYRRLTPSHANGKIALSQDEQALINELGTESIIRDGVWSLIPGKMHVANLKKGDIILNAKQTKDLLLNGATNSYGRSYAYGSLYNGMHSYSGLSGSGYNPWASSSGSSSIPSYSVSSPSYTGINNTSSSSNTKKNNKDDDSDDTSKKVKDLFDFIEIRISRLQRKIDKFKNNVDNTYKSFSKRNESLDKEIKSITTAISTQEKAYNRYMKEADKVDLSNSLKKKIRNGDIKLASYSDDKQKLIKKYQELYEKALDAKDGIDELKQSLIEASKVRFDLIVEKWDVKLQSLEHTAERLTSLIERRNAYASDHVSIDTSTKTAQDNIPTYQKLISTAQKEISKREKERAELIAQLNKDLNDPNSGLKEGTTAFKERMEEIYEVENKIDALSADIIDYSNQISEAYMTMFNNLATQYSNKMDLVSHLANEYSLALQKAEAKGLIATESYYENMRQVEQNNLSLLNEELKALQEQKRKALESGEIKLGSADYYEMTKQINDISEAIMEAELNIIEFNNSIREVKWKQFDYARDSVSNLNDEISFLVDLLGDEKLIDDKGKFTDEGLATLGLYGTSYNVLMAEADKYAEEIKKINEEIANDPANTKLLERQQELLKSQQSLILSANDQKQAIVDLVESGINKELSSMKELIQTYTESLDKQKELFDFQKRVKEQAKNIAELEKQLSAYQNDISEETKSKVQKLKVELESAKEDLEETQYEYMISEQKKMLDELYNDLEKTLNSRLDDVDALVEEMIATANKNAVTINETLQSATKDVGYTMTEEMDSIWSQAAASNGEIQSAITMYGEQFSTKQTATNEALGSIEKKIDAMIAEAKRQADEAAAQIEADRQKQEQADKEAAAEGEGNGTKQDAQNALKPSKEVKTETELVLGSDEVKIPEAKPLGDSNTSSKQGDGKVQVGDKVKYASGSYHAASDGSGASGSMYKGKQVYITKIKSGSKYPYHISTGKKLGSGDLGWLKKSQISGYASGLRKATKEEDAWVNEFGTEILMRPTENAMLTHVKPGDSILTPEGIDNIWQMANDPSQYLKKLSIPERQQGCNGNLSVTNSFDNITFTLPNVKNYEEFLYAMQHDRKAEQFIQSMTIDLLAGKKNGKQRFNF